MNWGHSFLFFCWLFLQLNFQIWFMNIELKKKKKIGDICEQTPLSLTSICHLSNELYFRVRFEVEILAIKCCKTRINKNQLPIIFLIINDYCICKQSVFFNHFRRHWTGDQNISRHLHYQQSIHKSRPSFKNPGQKKISKWHNDACRTGIAFCGFSILSR